MGCTTSAPTRNDIIMTSDKLVSLETAKLAKDKGFNWLCSSVKIETIEGSEREVYDEEECRYTTVKDVIKTRIPTQARLQKWLREAHGLHIDLGVWEDRDEDADGLCCGTYSYWSFNIQSCLTGDFIYEEFEHRYDTYEQALEDALKYALENLV